ncbi:MAG TPA: cbb3-type cytochrome c oxidase subunit II [Anaeromyxobacter sp.]|nr:cbb3-type cytochrome c oxidase subunit II [Anaeromyxobacter sp.]
MFRTSEKNTGIFFILATAFFLVGGLLTTLLPAVIEKSWSTPTEGQQPYTEQQLRGKAIYQREGCWYCHTQQVRTLLPDTKRFGWRGVDAPISTPEEYVRDNPHMLGTRRIGPDLARVGGKYDTSWHRTHFKNPRDLVKGSMMAPFPWLFQNDEQEFKDLVSYVQTLGRNVNWRPKDDYER